MEVQKIDNSSIVIFKNEEEYFKILSWGGKFIKRIIFINLLLIIRYLEIKKWFGNILMTCEVGKEILIDTLRKI